MLDRIVWDAYAVFSLIFWVWFIGALIYTRGRIVVDLVMWVLCVSGSIIYATTVTVLRSIWVIAVDAFYILLRETPILERFAILARFHLVRAWETLRTRRFIRDQVPFGR